VGKEWSVFTGKEWSQFLGKEWSEFTGKEWSAFVGKERREFVAKEWSKFVGKEWSDFVGKELSQFLGRWSLCTAVLERSCMSRRKPSFEPTSVSSLVQQQQVRLTLLGNDGLVVSLDSVSRPWGSDTASPC